MHSGRPLRGTRSDPPALSQSRLHSTRPWEEPQREVVSDPMLFATSARTFPFPVLKVNFTLQSRALGTVMFFSAKNLYCGASGSALSFEPSLSESKGTSPPLRVRFDQWFTEVPQPAYDNSALKLAPLMDE